jgi:peroxiredoxin
MNKLKSIFLTAFISFSAGVVLLAVAMLLAGGNLKIWVSVLAAALQVVAYFAWLYLARVPRTSPGLMGFTVGIFSVTIYSVFTSYEQLQPSAAPLLAFLVMAGWMAYITWYSELDRSNDRITVGKRLPKIFLETYDGKQVTSENLLGEKRLVLFYRGNWCPICTAQVHELNTFESQFKAKGVRITLVSPQSHEKSKKHALKYSLDFDFLVDKKNAAAKALGILSESGLPAGLKLLGYEGDVPKPTTFVLDEKGKVIYADLTDNYRVRPRPQDILKALDAEA